MLGNRSTPLTTRRSGGTAFLRRQRRRRRLRRNARRLTPALSGRSVIPWTCPEPERRDAPPLRSALTPTLTSGAVLSPTKPPSRQPRSRRTPMSATLWRPTGLSRICAVSAPNVVDPDNDAALGTSRRERRGAAGVVSPSRVAPRRRSLDRMVHDLDDFATEAKVRRAGSTPDWRLHCVSL
jgi:hypothetical protein